MLRAQRERDVLLHVGDEVQEHAEREQGGDGRERGAGEPHVAGDQHERCDPEGEETGGERQGPSGAEGRLPGAVGEDSALERPQHAVASVQAEVQPRGRVVPTPESGDQREYDGPRRELEGVDQDALRRRGSRRRHQPSRSRSPSI